MTEQTDQNTSETERLSSISPRTDRAAHNLHNRSKIIKFIKTALPLIAAALTAIIITWTFVSDRQNYVRPTEEGNQSVGKNELIKARFESVDSKNQPYTITATRAMRENDNEDRVILEKPQGEIAMNNGQTIGISAENGIYDQSQKFLNLTNTVKLYDGQGNNLQTQEMMIDIAKETINSTHDVRGNGPAGKITATGLHASNIEGTLRFEGPAKLVLNTNEDGGLKGLQ
jgi:lipopolysaccharide export system protein LptC